MHVSDKARRSRWTLLLMSSWTLSYEKLKKKSCKMNNFENCTVTFNSLWFHYEKMGPDKIHVYIEMYPTLNIIILAARI